MSCAAYLDSCTLACVRRCQHAVWTTQTSAWLSRCKPILSHNLGACASTAQDPSCLCWGQLGLPMEKAQYIHRLGRTARAGKSGKGLIILGESALHRWHGPSLLSGCQTLTFFSVINRGLREEVLAVAVRPANHAGAGTAAERAGRRRGRPRKGPGCCGLRVQSAGKAFC